MRKTKEVRSFFPKEKAQGTPHDSIPLLRVELQREQRLSLHKKSHGERAMGTGFTRRSCSLT